MRKRLMVLVFILFLSFPAYGGHSVSGGYACECRQAGCIEDYSGECGQMTATQSPDLSGLGIVLVGLLLWLRTRA